MLKNNIKTVQGHFNPDCFLAWNDNQKDLLDLKERLLNKMQSPFTENSQDPEAVAGAKGSSTFKRQLTPSAAWDECVSPTRNLNDFKEFLKAFNYEQIETFQALQSAYLYEYENHNWSPDRFIMSYQLSPIDQLFLRFNSLLSGSELWPRRVFEHMNQLVAENLKIKKFRHVVFDEIITDYSDVPDPADWDMKNMPTGHRNLRKRWIFYSKEKGCPVNWKGTPLSAIQKDQRPTIIAPSHFYYEPQVDCSRGMLAKFADHPVVFTYWLRNKVREPEEFQKFISIHSKARSNFLHQYNKYRSPDRYCHGRMLEFYRIIYKTNLTKVLISRNIPLAWTTDWITDAEPQIGGLNAFTREFAALNTLMSDIVNIYKAYNQRTENCTRVLEFIQGISALSPDRKSVV